MQEPDQELHGILHGIEGAVKAYWKAQSALSVKDITFVYESYLKYFRATKSGKEAPEPFSTGTLRSGLLDKVWEAILIREDIEADDHLVNGNYRPGGNPVPSLEALYVMAFKRLLQSVRLWQKQAGPRGYFGMLDEYVF